MSQTRKKDESNNAHHKAPKEHEAPQNHNSKAEDEIHINVRAMWESKNRDAFGLWHEEWDAEVASERKDEWTHKDVRDWQRFRAKEILALPELANTLNINPDHIHIETFYGYGGSELDEWQQFRSWNGYGELAHLVKANHSIFNQPTIDVIGVLSLRAQTESPDRGTELVDPDTTLPEEPLDDPAPSFPRKSDLPHIIVGETKHCLYNDKPESEAARLNKKNAIALTIHSKAKEKPVPRFMVLSHEYKGGELEKTVLKSGCRWIAVQDINFRGTYQHLNHMKSEQEKKQYLLDRHLKKKAPSGDASKVQGGMVDSLRKDSAVEESEQ